MSATSPTWTTRSTPPPTERGIAIRELTEETRAIYDEDVAALGALPPTVEPRATEHIAQMIAMIERLIAGGHAYAAEGHVLFDVSSKADYGKLSRRSLDEMIAGARVEVAPYKKNAGRFRAVEAVDAAQPGWDSPWGRGRPGWHIECSAMAGSIWARPSTFMAAASISIFPHHENEIAQSDGAHHGRPLATVWMHNGFLQVEGEKMSKSLGNFFTIRELLAEGPGEALRLALLAAITASRSISPAPAWRKPRASSTASIAARAGVRYRGRAGRAARRSPGGARGRPQHAAGDGAAA